MRTDLQGNPNRPSSAPRAYSPCRIALYPGRAPFWPPRGARRNLRMRYRLIWAVAKRRAHQSCIDRRSGPNRVGASRMAARARRRKVLRPDRPPKANARSPPDKMACFSSPAPGWLLGSRTVVLLALLVVYNDVIENASAMLLIVVGGVPPLKLPRERVRCLQLPSPPTGALAVAAWSRR